MKINLALDINDVNKVLVALGKFPCEQVFDLVVSIRTQTAEQTKAIAEAVPPPPPT